MTEGNPFQHKAFLDWADRAELPRKTIFEPFAGANDLIWHLQDMGLCNEYSSFDISPAHSTVTKRDTLKRFPSGDVCITNPPWLAKNSATLRGLSYPHTAYDNLYKFALDKCLSNCKWVAALVPESFIRANDAFLMGRLTDFISLTSKLFKDTAHPVGLALFQPHRSEDTRVWTDRGEKHLSVLKSLRPEPHKRGVKITFNNPDGNVGLIAFDNTQSASIRFCDVSELKHYQVKNTGRFITKVRVDAKVRIDDWNNYLNAFRLKTWDILMTCYRGIRRDGMYRRRLDWNLARGIIHNA